MGIKKISSDVFAVGSQGGAAVFFSKDKNVTHTPAKISDTDTGSNTWCDWGEDNLYPQETMRKLKKVGAAVGGLEVLTSAHFGVGFRLFQERETDGGNVELVERSTLGFPEIRSFFSRTRFNLFNSEIVTDYEGFKLAFPEYLLSPNGEKIISVKRIQAANCRFAKPNKQGLIEKVFINSDWENYKEEYTQELPCFDSSFSTEEIKQYCKEKKILRFTIPVIDALSVEKIYPSVGWHSSFRNGWIDVLLSVPEFKNAMFKNQFNFKYLVHIADDYFVHRYGVQDWNSFSSEQKEEKRKNLLEAIDDHMSGNKAAGRSLVSPYFRDEKNNLIKGIQIEEIPQTMANGEYLLDVSVGNAEVLFPMGVDPCLLGAGIPGSKSLSGSGSDKREAYTILAARMPIKQARTLEIFDRIRDWNGWDPSLVGKFPNVNLTTLDKNPNGVTKVVN